MAKYRIKLSPKYGDHIYDESTRAIHIAIYDIFDRTWTFGDWCEDSIIVTNSETEVSVEFGPQSDASVYLDSFTPYVQYSAIHEGKLLHLIVWKDKETRDRNFRTNK
jgi:hypothetical protein